MSGYILLVQWQASASWFLQNFGSSSADLAVATLYRNRRSIGNKLRTRSSTAQLILVPPQESTFLPPVPQSVTETRRSGEIWSRSNNHFNRQGIMEFEADPSYSSYTLEEM
ncbi:hypothetical protein GWI33_012578 [Rhynchophorus ferrugineus]|uniref:Uncharacterized protein n=1 Tax=Rhynchophorus ferrugineus TaxID=354439 RepID=A0A834I684_RHYFE|nr:hypothetical protein GWI33_012578 [Rhynchophorus ferrugineus]